MLMCWQPLHTPYTQDVLSHPGSIAEMCDTKYSSIRPQYFPVHRADKKLQV